jgi:hypothetical protein
MVQIHPIPVEPNPRVRIAIAKESDRRLGVTIVGSQYVRPPKAIVAQICTINVEN